MMSNGFLVECSNCLKVGKKQILGRVMDNGDLLVLRFHHGTTLLRAEEYKLICGCGYELSIAGTVILQTVLQPQIQP